MWIAITDEILSHKLFLSLIRNGLKITLLNVPMSSGMHSREFGNGTYVLGITNHLLFTPSSLSFFLALSLSHPVSLSLSLSPFFLFISSLSFSLSLLVCCRKKHHGKYAKPNQSVSSLSLSPLFFFLSLSLSLLSLFLSSLSLSCNANHFSLYLSPFPLSFSLFLLLLPLPLSLNTMAGVIGCVTAIKMRLRTLLRRRTAQANAVASYANGMKGVTCDTSES
jgi:hypothetical protein